MLELALKYINKKSLKHKNHRGRLGNEMGEGGGGLNGFALGSALIHHTLIWSGLRGRFLASKNNKSEKQRSKLKLK